MIYHKVRNNLSEIIGRLWKYKGVKIVEGHLTADYVHLLLMIPPKISISNFMGDLKGKSTMMLFERHAYLK